MPKFRERPKEVEAVLWDGTDEALTAIEKLTGETDIRGPGSSLTVDGLDGPSVVRLGWWVVKDVGSYGYSPERFALFYECRKVQRLGETIADVLIRALQAGAQ